MKVAIPTRNQFVEDHFGHCETYTIFTANETKNIVQSEILSSQQSCGCKSNIASILKDKGVSVMLAGNIGGGALNVLRNHGIEVYRGCSGDVHHLVEAFLKGNIEDSGEGCRHNKKHGDGHVCNH